MEALSNRGGERQRRASRLSKIGSLSVDSRRSLTLWERAGTSATLVWLQQQQQQLVGSSTVPVGVEPGM
jgi:hypothetical protein